MYFKFLYWNIPVLVNTGNKFLVYQYCLKMLYLCLLEGAGVMRMLIDWNVENGLGPISISSKLKSFVTLSYEASHLLNLS